MWSLKVGFILSNYSLCPCLPLQEKSCVTTHNSSSSQRRKLFWILINRFENILLCSLSLYLPGLYRNEPQHCQVLPGTHKLSSVKTPKSWPVQPSTPSTVSHKQLQHGHWPLDQLVSAPKLTPRDSQVWIYCRFHKHGNRDIDLGVRSLYLSAWYFG